MILSIVALIVSLISFAACAFEILLARKGHSPVTDKLGERVEYIEDRLDALVSESGPFARKRRKQKPAVSEVST